MTFEPPLGRREIIATRLRDGQPVVATALAAEFAVSEDAIRRDLRALAAEGRCQRVYGGALPISPATATMAARMDDKRERKLRLARAGAATIKPGELVFLDCGSTNLALTEFLPEDCDLTVATNAVDIAAAILRRQDVRLIVVGGLANSIVGGCVDAAAAQCVATMRIDRTFLGACSVSADHGIGAFQFDDATFKRTLIAASHAKVVMATTEKFTVHTPHHVADLNQIDVLVLEGDATQSHASACERSGCGSVISAESD